MSLTSKIVNAATNAIHLTSLSKELNLDDKVLEEVLKKSELENVLIYTPSDQLITPTWKRLRNILYIPFVQKELQTELQNLIEQDIKSVTSEYKIDYQDKTENFKITLIVPDQEETLTKILFDKLFMKTYSIHDKHFTINCAIEEEQISAVNPSDLHKLNNISIPSINDQEKRYGFNYLTQLYFQQLLMFSRQAAEFQKYQSLRKQNKNSKYKDSNPNNNISFEKNTLKSVENKEEFNHRSKQNHLSKNGHYDKYNIKSYGHKQAQKIFNANENDFPSLK